MSQFFQSVTTTSVPSNVATSYGLDSGTSVPINNLLDIFGNFTSANSTKGITTIVGNPTNIIYVELTNRFATSVPCPINTTTTLVSFALNGAANTSYRFTFNVIGRDIVDGTTVGFTLFSTFKTNGTTATLIGIPFIDTDEDTTQIPCVLSMVAGTGVNQNTVFLQITVSNTHNLVVSTVGTYLQV